MERSKTRSLVLQKSSASRTTGLIWNSRTRSAWLSSSEKARELYPDSLLQTDAIYVSCDRVITEWTFQANVTEPGYYAGVSLTFPVSVHGVSIVLIENGKVADWSDYYDKLTSRRSTLASYFTEWVEL